MAACMKADLETVLTGALYICSTDTLILKLSVTSKRNCFFIPLTIAAFGQSRPADSLVPIHKHTE